MTAKKYQKCLYLILFILFIACNSEEKNTLNEYNVVDSFKYTKDSSDIAPLNNNKIIVKKDKELNLNELIVYSEKSIKNFTINERKLLVEDGVYAIISDKEIIILNTSENSDSKNKFNLIKHYFEIFSIFDEEVESIYISDSCTSTAINIEGKEESKTFKYDQILSNNIYQLITETSNYFFIYKIDLSENPNFYRELEPIVSLLKSNWYEYSDLPIERVFLDERDEFIEKRETYFTDHNHVKSDTKFEWEANNKKQSYSISKFIYLENIKDEF